MLYNPCDYLTYKTYKTIHLFMPNHFFDKKKKGQELKQNNLKYLRDSSDYLTYKTKQNLNFPFCPFSHLLMLNQFFDTKKGQELKKNTYVTSQEQG